MLKSTIGSQHHLQLLLLTAQLLLLSQSCTGSTVRVEQMEILPKSNRSNELLSDLLQSMSSEIEISIDTNRNQIAASNATLATAAASGVAIVTAVTQQNMEAGVNNGLSFTPPIAGLKLCVAWQRVAQSSLSIRDGFYFVNVFHSSVWSLLLLSLLLCSAAMLLLEAAHPIGMRLKTPGRQRLAAGALTPLQAFTFTVAGLLQVGQPVSPKSASARLLAFFWWVFALVICTAYVACTVIQLMATASVSGSSSSSSSHGTASSGIDLSQAVQRANRTVCSEASLVCTLAAEQKQAKSTIMSSVLSLNRTLATNDAEAADMLLGNQGDRLLLLTNQFACANLQSLARDRVSVAMATDSLAWLVLATNASDESSRLLSNAAIRLAASGHVSRLEADYGLSSSSSSSSSGSSSSWQQQLLQSLPLRLTEMIGPLLLLGVGFAAAACCALCEFAFYRFFIDDAEEGEAEDGRALYNSGVSVAETADTYM